MRHSASVTPISQPEHMKHLVIAGALGGVIGLGAAIAQLSVGAADCGTGLQVLLDVTNWPVEAGLEAYCDIFHDGNIEGAMPIAIPVLVAYWIILGSTIAMMIALFMQASRRWFSSRKRDR